MTKIEPISDAHLKDLEEAEQFLPADKILCPIQRKDLRGLIERLKTAEIKAQQVEMQLTEEICALKIRIQELEHHTSHNSGFGGDP